MTAHEEDPRLAFDDTFAELFMGIEDRAYDLLPDESDDADIRSAVERAVAEHEDRTPIDWSAIPAALRSWFNPVNIYTFMSSLKFLPEGYTQALVDLPEEVPADPTPYREVLIQGLIAATEAYLEMLASGDESEDQPELA